mmetsp:Transcript_19331/g.46348  ORF Transcript_19331/g.46348 Transcript_19331/m.46348 type:complete len:256 (+) Transcript_19331:911-1678(+)
MGGDLHPKLDERLRIHADRTHLGVVLPLHSRPALERLVWVCRPREAHELPSSRASADCGEELIERLAEAIHPRLDACFELREVVALVPDLELGDTCPEEGEAILRGDGVAWSVQIQGARGSARHQVGRRPVAFSLAESFAVVRVDAKHERAPFVGLNLLGVHGPRARLEEEIAEGIVAVEARRASGESGSQPRLFGYASAVLLACSELSCEEINRLRLKREEEGEASEVFDSLERHLCRLLEAQGLHPSATLARD